MTKPLLLTAILFAGVGFPCAARAETWIEQGEASTGEMVALDIDSVKPTQNAGNFRFVYTIGPDTVKAAVNCHTKRVSPQGFNSFVPNLDSATDRMVDRVCQIGGKFRQPKLSTAPSTTSGLPLQVGMYRVGSRYIQIAAQGDRLCYQGSTVNGSTTASLRPMSAMPGFYQIHGWDDIFLKQETTDTILFGTKHQLGPYPADYSLPRDVNQILQACLDSREDFFQQETVQRGR